MRSNACALLAVVLVGSTAFAEDINPPAWRGIAGSTYQNWDFLPNTPQGAPDAGVNNPYGSPIASAAPATYVAQMGARSGIWQLNSEDALQFIVPALNVPAVTNSELWIQVTWFGPVPPLAFGYLGDNTTPLDFLGQSTLELADGWHLTTYRLLAHEATPEFGLTIKNHLPNVSGSTMYVDQVVIDTMSIIPAPGVGAMGLAGLIIAAGRRRR
ncbi:MAG: hypothetical protein J0L78_01245 [Planctomycetes bacterium]|nr:hypothetical protein [Planctomycetota bacterium]